MSYVGDPPRLWFPSGSPEKANPMLPEETVYLQGGNNYISYRVFILILWWRLFRLRNVSTNHFSGGFLWKLVAIYKPAKLVCLCKAPYHVSYSIYHIHVYNINKSPLARHPSVENSPRGAWNSASFDCGDFDGSSRFRSK